MNIFKRKARRTTVVISDQTRTSHASLSSFENKRSSPLGSKSSVKSSPETGSSAVEDYHGSSTVRFDVSCFPFLNCVVIRNVFIIHC